MDQEIIYLGILTTIFAILFACTSSVSFGFLTGVFAGVFLSLSIDHVRQTL